MGITAKDTYFAVGDVGSEVNLSTYIDNVEFPEEVETIADDTFGSNSRKFIVGLATGTFSLSGPWSDTIETTLAAVKAANLAGTVQNAIYGPEGNTSGDTEYNASVLLTNYSKSASAGGRVDFSAEFQITGDVTRGTFA